MTLGDNLVIEMMPSNGDPINWSALALKISEFLGRELEEAEVDNFIQAAYPHISWDSENRQVRIASPSRFPEAIHQESDLEPWFERYVLR